MEIRNTLTDIYIGRKIYGSATRLYMEQIQDIRVRNMDRLYAMLAIFDLEERFGDVK